jgi:hypothetical protein
MQEEEILEYIKRWEKVPPDQILRYMEEMRDFLLTPHDQRRKESVQSSFKHQALKLA